MYHHEVGPRILVTPSYFGILYLQIESHYKEQIMRKPLQCFCYKSESKQCLFHGVIK